MRQRARRGHQARHRGSIAAGWRRETGGSRRAVPLMRPRWIVLGRGDSALCR
ncbi:MAG TPA: hypothetical protein VGI00_22810 [Streptosporangiaceae bacterium]